jgi:hypothetical protein
MARRFPRTVTAFLLVVMLGPPAALADGDPASDTLLAQNVFYPYQPAVSVSVTRVLDAETAAAAHAHFPIKVAIIGSAVDLGVVPQLFQQPQTYAEFLDQEISFQGRQLLLVVMPSGYGVAGLGPAATRAAASLAKPVGSQTNELARAAIAAVPKLAAAAGHPIGRSVIPSGSSGGGSTAVILVILALAAAGTAAVLIALRRRGPGASPEGR